MQLEPQNTVGTAASRELDILLVEDNPSYVELTQRALREIAGEDLRLEIAGDGMRALEILLQGRASPRLVISDINMPRMDGLELLRRLRQTPSTRCLPVVMLSSSSAASDITQCYALGANGYVMRPMNFQSYIEMLSNLIAYWLVINIPAPR